MEIGKCSCNHAAISYHEIDRHFKKLPDGRHIYSDYCQEPDCKCERAKILAPEINPAVEKEKARWSRMVAEILG